MDIRTPPTSPWRPGRRGPIGDRILQKEIRWRAPKCDYHLPATLVQIGDALATREAHPDSSKAPGSQTDRLRQVWFWRGGGKQRPSYWKVGVGHSERRPSTWVGALSRAMASDVPGSAGKPEQVLQRAESVLPVQNRPISGRAPFWPTQGARRNLGVCVRLIRAVSTRRTTQSCIDPAF